MSDINAQLLQSNVSPIKTQIHVETKLSLENKSTAIRNGTDKRTATPQTIGSPRLFILRYLKYKHFYASIF
jgi:hypothetical protein